VKADMFADTLTLTAEDAESVKEQLYQMGSALSDLVSEEIERFETLSLVEGNFNSMLAQASYSGRFRSEPEVSIEAEIEKLFQWIKEQGVALKRIDQVREYLLQFPDLLDIIPEAICSTRKHFPEGQLTLDIYQDPEIEDQYLVLYVRLAHYDETTLDRLQKAEAAFLDALSDREGWIQLTTDFREPGGSNVL